MKNLKQKTITGLSWSFIDSFTKYGINFIFSIILARLLSPKEFGLIGIIMLFLTLSVIIINSGFSKALIRKLDVTDIDYSTIFFINIIIGITLYGILYYSSPFLSDFFNSKILEKLFKVMGLILIINSLAQVHQTILNTRIDFKLSTKISFFAFITSGIIGIILALKGFGVWSLALQILIRSLIQNSLLWFYIKWTPQFNFSYQSFRELFYIGSKLLFTDVIETLFKNSYYLIIAKFHTPISLGYYTRAESFNTLVSYNLTLIIQRVNYSILSKIQHNEDLLKKVFRKLTKSVALLSFFLLLILAAISKSLILVLIGSKWFTTISYLQLLAVASIFYPLYKLNLDLLTIKGRTDKVLGIEIINKVLIIPTIIVGVYVGIIEMLSGFIIASWLIYFVSLFVIKNTIDYSLKDQIIDIYPQFLLSAITAFLVWLISLINIGNLYILSLQLFFSSVFLILQLEILKNEEYFDLKKILKQKFSFISAK